MNIMFNKKVLMLLLVFGFSFAAYAEEDQKFYDRDLLTETLTADDQAELTMAEEVLTTAETDLSAAQTDLTAQETALTSAQSSLSDAELALSSLTTTDLGYDAAAQAVIDAQTAVTNVENSLADTNQSILNAEADIEMANDALAVIQTEFSDTAAFVEGLSEEQVFALNRSLNNAVKSGLVTDIDSEDLAQLAGANKHQINAFTQAFEQEARFSLKADKFDAKYDESGNEKFLEMSARMISKAEIQKEKFLNKLTNFFESPSATAGSIARTEAKISAKGTARDSSKKIAKTKASVSAKKVAKDISKKLAKSTAKETAKTTAKETAKAAAKDNAKGIAKSEAKRSAKALAKRG